MTPLQQIHQGIVVSVQADEGEPFYNIEALEAMALSVLNGGACGLRMANANNIAHLKKLRADIPLLGITKPSKIPANFRELVYITPTWADLVSLQQVGTEIIALDATPRPRPGGEQLSEIVSRAKKEFPSLLLMADVSTLEEGLQAEAMGFDVISTTLSGYTIETQEKAKTGPDFELLAALMKQVKIPVIMEGRIWEPHEITKAFELGAYSVVIGSAITRPHLITERFCQKIPKQTS